jgi:hypothetical protein
MRILLTGAGGNIGRGLVPLLTTSGHDLVLSDLNVLPDDPAYAGIPFHQLDVQHGFGLERASEGVDLIVHTPAWHGVHWRSKTEADFWRLNVDGTFWALQAARSAGVSRFVFLSSQAWHGHYDKYGFTKRIGEELCEYHRNTNGVRYVAVRPADLTPWGDDWVNRYGARLLYGGVDREDVLHAVAASVEKLSGAAPAEPEGIILDAVRPNAFDESQIEGWDADPVGVCERIFPDSAALIDKYGIDIKRRPAVLHSHLGWEEVGYRPQRHFGTFLDELRALDESGGPAAVQAKRCPY